MGYKCLCYIAGETIDIEKIGLLGIESSKEFAALSSSAPFFHRWGNWWQEMGYSLSTIMHSEKEIHERESYSGENLGLGHQGKQTHRRQTKKWYRGRGLGS